MDSTLGSLLASKFSFISTPLLAGGRNDALRNFQPDSKFLKVNEGQMTFDAEGREGAAFFSRMIHKPVGENSGVTIGRGYDMGSRTRTEIVGHLTSAGISLHHATQFSEAAGLKGYQAQQFVKLNKQSAPIISLEEQNNLFKKVVYPHYQGVAQRLATKPDVTAAYGSVNWDSLHPGIKEVLTDLTYRGDYTPMLRQRIQKLIVIQDLEGLYRDLSDRDLWKPGSFRHVPVDRFLRRAEFLNRMLAGTQ